MLFSLVFADGERSYSNHSWDGPETGDKLELPGEGGPSSPPAATGPHRHHPRANTNGGLALNAAEKSVPYKKLKRPCFFCGVLQSKLVSHFKSVHKNEEKVQAALKLPEKEQTRAFEGLRKEGILMHNIKNQQEGKGEIIRERRQGSSDVVVKGR